MGDFLSEISKRILIYDGSKGYMLQKYGLKGEECPESWNISKSDIVREIYTSYKNAGSDVIQTNTFTGNRILLEKYSLGDKVYKLNYEAARIAKEVMGQDGFVSGSIGPTGILFEPFGELTFKRAYRIYQEQVRALIDGGVDVINFETFTDVSEMRAALIATKDMTDIPTICSISFSQNGRTLMGTDVETTVIILKSLGADMIGTNCSFGPGPMVSIVKEMSLFGGGYLSVKPNAGLPEIVDGMPVYTEPIGEFISTVSKFAEFGGRLIGGCCGTTPEFIKAIKKEVDDLLQENERKRQWLDLNAFDISSTKITSGVKTSDTTNINFENSNYRSGKDNNNIGRLIPKDDENIWALLEEGDPDVIYNLVADLALDLASEDPDLIYVNVDNTGNTSNIGKLLHENIKENSDIMMQDKCQEEIEMHTSKNNNLLAKVINIAQEFLKQPFIIETNNPLALENALKIYKGRGGVIKKDVLRGVAKKYGAVLLDKNVVK